MKAEDTVTIDLTGKSSIADTMVVTSGRSNRHVGAVAERVLEVLGDSDFQWHYRELDPDVFGEELAESAYASAERIAAVVLEVHRGT